MTHLLLIISIAPDSLGMGLLVGEAHGGYGCALTCRLLFDVQDLFWCTGTFRFQGICVCFDPFDVAWEGRLISFVFDGQDKIHVTFKHLCWVLKG